MSLIKKEGPSPRTGAAKSSFSSVTSMMFRLGIESTQEKTSTPAHNSVLGRA